MGRRQPRREPKPRHLRGVARRPEPPGARRPGVPPRVEPVGPAVPQRHASRSKPQGRAKPGIRNGHRNPPSGLQYPSRSGATKTKKWQQNDQGTRPAHVYVFCLHKPVPATNANVADPTTWDFWVIPAQVLDDELGEQKTVRPTRLDGLAKRIGSGRLGWSEIKPAVDRLID